MLRAWFIALYEILLGQSEGPRTGLVHRPLRRSRDHRPDRARACAGDDLAAVPAA
ncbi:MAG: hypothetical protein U1E38_01655 [Rhodospirillales bacterium]